MKKKRNTLFSSDGVDKFPNPTTHLHRCRRLLLADHAQPVLPLHALLHVVLLAHSPRHSHPVRVMRQGGHRGTTHGLVLLPVFPLAVGVAVVGLGALAALGQVMAVVAAMKALEDGDPKRFGAVILFRRHRDGLLFLFRSGAVVSSLGGSGGRGPAGGVVAVAVVARGRFLSVA